MKTTTRINGAGVYEVVVPYGEWDCNEYGAAGEALVEARALSAVHNCRVNIVLPNGVILGAVRANGTTIHVGQSK